MSKKWLAALGTVVSLSVHAFTPAAGTWVINGELNGKPGRGLAIDVQNGTVVVQVYAYEQSGAPTFYMGTSTSYTGQNIMVGPKVAVIPLKQYQGGRYLGSGDRSANELKTLGNATLTFTDSHTGTISLPGEPTVAMSRFDFSGYGLTDKRNLLGEWVFTAFNNSTGTMTAEYVHLNQLMDFQNTWGTGRVRSKDGKVDCEHDADDGFTYCFMYEPEGSGAKLVRRYIFKKALNLGEGDMLDANKNYIGPAWMQRVVDQNGNLINVMRSSKVPSLPENIRSDD